MAQYSNGADTQALLPAAPETGEVPKPPQDLIQGVWAHAWAAAQALVQTALAAAQAKAEALAAALGMAQQDAAAAQAEADQAQADFTAVVARLESLEGVHKSEIDQVQYAHQEQVLALRSGLSEVRNEAEQARHALDVAKARHEADLALLRGELDRQVNQLADLRAALQQRPAPATEKGPDLQGE